MATASFLHRQRRAALLGAAVVLLHVAVFDLFSTKLRTRPRVREAEPVTIVAHLLADAPKPAAAPAPHPQLPVPARPRPVHRARPPVPEPAPAALPEQQPVENVAGEATLNGEATAQAGQGEALRGAADAPVDVESATQAQAASTPEAPAAPATRSYKVDMPPAADITLDVARTDADGTRWSGEAELSWKLDGDGYRVDIQAGIRVLFTRVNLLVLTSEGAIDESGFAPRTMTEKRRGRALTATHFNRQDGLITFSASQASYPLAAGAQDKASVPLQLSAIARGDPNQLSGNIDIQVGEDRDASVYRFVVVGQEQIDTRLGRIATWHLARPPKPGSYNSRLDIWLAPGRSWYPVQIRNLEASGAVTTQTVNNIVMNNTGS